MTPSLVLLGKRQVLDLFPSFSLSVSSDVIYFGILHIPSFDKNGRSVLPSFAKTVWDRSWYLARFGGRKTLTLRTPIKMSAVAISVINIARLIRQSLFL